MKKCTCTNCQKLEKVRLSILKALAFPGKGLGEEARLLWDAALRDFPCRVKTSPLTTTDGPF